MLEFTVSKTYLKRYKHQNLFLILFFGLLFVAFTSGFWTAGPGLMNSLALWTSLFVALGVGFAYWVFRGMFSRQAEAAASQRVTLDADGIVNTNSAWTHIYTYNDIEKLTVRRASSGEVKGVVLQLPKRLVDLSTLERQDELYTTLAQKLPHVPVETQSVSWQRARNISGFILMVLLVLLLNDRNSALAMSGLLFCFGANALLGRERVFGTMRERRQAWVAFLVAGLLVVDVAISLL